MVLGGGVGDSYQPLEERRRLARGALEILDAHGLPVHVLTKSTLVLRDTDILEKINRRSRALVSFSISSVRDEVCSAFEPGAPPASARLEALAALRARGIPCGVFLLPVIPFVTDSWACIEESVRAAAAAGADFVVFGGMTLKPGRQMAHFLEVLDREAPGHREQVSELYPEDPCGAPRGSYYRRIGLLFGDAARRHSMAPRMPLALFADLVEDSDRSAVLREHRRAFRELGMPDPTGSYSSFT